MIDKEDEILISKGFEYINIPITQDIISKIGSYINIYLEWNSKFNISSIRTIKDILTKHFIDSIIAIPVIMDFNKVYPALRIIDLGSGGGFPGLAIKIACPNLKIDLAEVNKKKICFLKELILNLQLQDVQIVDSSIGKVSQKYNILLTRAFGNLKKIFLESKKYINNGMLVCYKGKSDIIHNEINELPDYIQKKIIVQNVKNPFIKDERHLVLINL